MERWEGKKKPKERNIYYCTFSTIIPSLQIDNVFWVWPQTASNGEAPILELWNHSFIAITPRSTLIWVNGISIFLGYLMPKPSL